MRERPTPRETGRLIDVDEREFVYLVRAVETCTSTLETRESRLESRVRVVCRENPRV